MLYDLLQHNLSAARTNFVDWNSFVPWKYEILEKVSIQETSAQEFMRLFQRLVYPAESNKRKPVRCVTMLCQWAKAQAQKHWCVTVFSLCFSHFHADKEDFRSEFKVPPFQDCVLSFLGFSDEEKVNMEERTLKHG